MFLVNRYSGPETVLDFDESPMSALMEGRRKEIESEEKRSFEELTLSVIRYVTKELNLSSLEDVEKAIRPKEQETYLLNAHRVMHKKSYHMRKVLADSKRTASPVAFERTPVIRDDMSVATVCEGCRIYTVEDTNPIFGTANPVKGLYITRSIERCPSGCSTPPPGKKSALRLDLIPVDSTIRYMGQKQFRQLVQQEKQRLKKVERRGSSRKVAS